MSRRNHGLLRTSIALSAMISTLGWIEPLHAGPAVHQFEVKRLETEAGEVELQSQNAYAWGEPRRRFAEEEPGEFVFEDNTVTPQRNALEVEASLTNFFRTRLGIEFEKEWLEEPSTPAEANAYGPWELTELAIEGVLVLVPIKPNSVGWGLLSEFEHPVTGEANTILGGPIIEARLGPWTATANLVVTKYFGGEAEDGIRDNKLDFTYAAQIAYAASDTWLLTIEAYGTVDRLGNSGTRTEEALLFGDHDQHRIGPVIYYELPLAKEPGESSGKDEKDEGATATLGVGFLAGLNENTPSTTLKLSLELDY